MKSCTAIISISIILGCLSSLLRCSYLYFFLFYCFYGKSLIGFLIQYATSRYVTVLVIGRVQLVDHYTAASGGMCEASVTNINACMGYFPVVLAASIEEYKISRLQVGLGYLSAYCCLVCRSTRQINARLIEDMNDKSGAIEAAGRVAAILILGSDDFIDAFLHFGACHDASRLECEQQCKSSE